METKIHTKNLVYFKPSSIINFWVSYFSSEQHHMNIDITLYRVFSLVFSIWVHPNKPTGSGPNANKDRNFNRNFQEIFCESLQNLEISKIFFKNLFGCKYTIFFWLEISKIFLLRNRNFQILFGSKYPIFFLVRKFQDFFEIFKQFLKILRFLFENPFQSRSVIQKF